MKKIISFILLPVLFQINLSAQQTYLHCLDGDDPVRWSVLFEVYDAWPESMEFIAYGDTTINGISYKLLFEDYSRLEEFDENNDSWKNHPIELYNNLSRFFIRESEDASQLYLFDDFYNKEYLISDMDLQVGDEFPVPEIWDAVNAGRGYLTVDSVYSENGLRHIQLDYEFYVWDSGEMNSEIHKLTFIEGVGSNIGLWGSWGYYQVLTCFQNQSRFYKNEKISVPCGYRETWESINTLHAYKDYFFKVINNHIEISCLADDNVQISIYDISGRLLYIRDFSGKETISIPASAYPKGVYLLKIFNKNKNQAGISKIIL